MSSLYDRADIYDMFENDARYQAYKEHWVTVVKDKDIKTILDVSIGSGVVTLPVLDLGISLCGSDLNNTMLSNCEKKVQDRKDTVELQCSDFRELSCWGNRTFDLVASTGNSLAHVCNEDVMKALEQMNSHVAEHGYLYLDTRNWDKILS